MPSTLRPRVRMRRVLNGVIPRDDFEALIALFTAAASSGASLAGNDRPVLIFTKNPDNFEELEDGSLDRAVVVHDITVNGSGLFLLNVTLQAEQPLRGTLRLAVGEYPNHYKAVFTQS